MKKYSYAFRGLVVLLIAGGSASVVARTATHARPHPSPAARAPLGENYDTLIGHVTDEISAHVSSYPRGKEIEQEFQLMNGNRIVVYAKTQMHCAGRMKLTGHWFSLTATPVVRNGEVVSKTRDTYTTQHFNVDTWSCL